MNLIYISSTFINLDNIGQIKASRSEKAYFLDFFSSENKHIHAVEFDKKDVILFNDTMQKLMDKCAIKVTEWIPEPTTENN